MKYFLFLSIIFVLFCIPVLSQSKGVLNQKQAVAIAEKFVAEKGYATKEMGIVETYKTGKRTSNLIEPYALTALIKKEGGQSFWSVGFRFYEQDYKNQEVREKRDGLDLTVIYDFGREVRVSLDGKKVWIMKKPLPVWEAHIFGDCVGEGEQNQPAGKP